MKKSILIIIGIWVSLGCAMGNTEAETQNVSSSEGTITVKCSPDLFNLTSLWAEEYGIINKESKILVKEIGDNLTLGQLGSEINFGFVSSNQLNSIDHESLWEIVIGRDIIVPIMNKNNPFIEKINKQGISSNELALVIKNPEKSNWETLLGSEQKASLNFYITDNETVQTLVANYLLLDRESIKGKSYANAKEMIGTIQNDPYAIGFCRITDIVDANNQSLLENIKLLPIDKNGNNQIDSFEKIYDDLNSFTRGVWIGKYPRELFTNIYAISSDKPENDLEKAFVKWVITDGQQLLASNGFSELVASEKQSKIEKLYDVRVDTEAPVNSYAGLKFLIAILVIALLVGASIRIYNVIISRRKAKKLIGSSTNDLSVKKDSANLPGGLFFDKSHTWAFMEKDGKVKIGLDDFLPKLTGDFTGIKMKLPGEKINRGEAIITLIQRGKQLNIKSPISGIIKERNSVLAASTVLISTNPFSDGWVYLVEPTNWLREIQFLLMAEKFNSWLKTEIIRIKDFLAAIQNANEYKYAHVILQEGGEIKEAALMDLGPEVWEDFQSQIINTIA